MTKAPGLIQHVNVPTQRSGHTLDLIITRASDLIVSQPHASFYVSDHSFVECKLSLPRAPLTVKNVTFRKIKNQDFQGPRPGVGGS